MDISAASTLPTLSVAPTAVQSQKTLERFLTARSRFETPEAERAELHKVFVMFDTNCDGRLSIEEIRNSMDKLGIQISPADLSSLISSRRYDDDDDDGHGHGHGHTEEDIDFTFFCRLYRDLCYPDEEERRDLGDGVWTPSGKASSDSDLRYVFHLFDENGDGFISASELQSVLTKLGFKEGHSLEQCQKMIEKVDSDKDGAVSFEEFRIMMKSSHGWTDSTTEKAHT
jgi:calcium-binding protein CML